MVDQRLRVGVDTMPCAAAIALPSFTRPLNERAQVGALADAPVRQPGERADRVRRRVEDDLRHCAGRASATASDGMPSVHASASRSISSALADWPARTAEGRVALTSHCTTPGLEQLARREGGAADHPPTWRARVSSLPTPFITDATRPREDVRGGGDRRLGGAIALVATMLSSHGGISEASLVARSRPTTSPAPVNGARARCRVTSGREIERPHSTSSRVARFAAKSEPTAPQPTMPDPHSVVPSVMGGRCPVLLRGRVRGIANSRPP